MSKKSVRVRRTAAGNFRPKKQSKPSTSKRLEVAKLIKFSNEKVSKEVVGPVFAQPKKSNQLMTPPEEELAIKYVLDRAPGEK